MNTTITADLAGLLFIIDRCQAIRDRAVEIRETAVREAGQLVRRQPISD
ncbi:hypothetical protein [Allomesorhizobium alhagi]|uniref:Uncharacterized protein n=1 Tax=Mesorhizobium alhagi CCNWXJ12-2 TaxID=1107882 RepID=H0I2Z1_9HYPH|nr:hypothetical protein [Mesorhizobium alhagi]EHK52629.1 hypothetical protein MAXJ12_34244 [Mesorhizobium alhagi CCNWXJ12-2]